MAHGVPTYIINLLQNIVKEDINNFAISVKPNKKGQGSLGEVSFLTLTGKTGAKSYNFVVKKAFSEKNARKIHPIRDVFLNEIYFYSEVCKRFRDFQLSIPPVKVFDKIPNCFAYSKEEFSEVLILENLELQEFVTSDKFSSFKADDVELIFKSLGRFHAISFAYRAMHPEKFSELSKELKDQWHKFKNMMADMFRITHEMAKKNLLHEDHRVFEKYNKYIENSVEIFSESLIYEGNYSAVLHGDCWSSNMFFKYNESGKIVDLRLLDFQICRVGTPVYDLSYCLYSGAEKEIIEDLDHYLRIYHNSLSEAITEFGCDPNLLYPFAALKGDWKKYCKFGFIMGLLVWKCRLIYEESMNEFSNFQGADNKIAEEFLDAKFDEETFRRISRDLIIHMYENDFL